MLTGTNWKRGSIQQGYSEELPSKGPYSRIDGAKLMLNVESSVPLMVKSVVQDRFLRDFYARRNKSQPSVFMRDISPPDLRQN